MKILVTGGLGFIGSHLVDFLIENGHNVVIVDDLSNGSMDNLNPKAKLYQMDILSPEFDHVFETENFDIVYHLAAQINVQTSVADTVFDARVNIMGTIAVLECVKKHGVKKIVYASSAAVYGEPHYLPVNEKHPTNPVSYYGISKYVPEYYIRTYSDMYHFDYTILRYSNVYGERQCIDGEGGIVSIITNCFINQLALTIYGSGEQTRDFIYVNDIATANLLALDRGSKETFNISTSIYTSVNQLFQMMQSIYGCEIGSHYADEREGDILNSYLCNQKARDLLGFVPKYTLHQGLENTINYYKEKEA